MEPELRRRLAGLDPEQRADLLRTMRRRRPGHPPPGGAQPHQRSGRLAVSPADTVLPIAPSGDRPALFCVHSVGGSAMPFLPLAERLGPDRPCYGLEAFGLHGGEPHRTVDQLTAWQVAAIRRVQPTGPYHLTGWSAGGTLAFEIALALQRRGDQVGVLALIDTSPPTEWPVPVGDVEALRLFATSFALTLGRRPVELDEPALAALDAHTRITATVDALAAAGMVAPEDLPRVQARARVAVAMICAGHTARPGRYRGALDLLVAQREPRAGAAPAGWHRHVDGLVTVHPVPGDHYTVLSPEHLPAVAGVLRALLASDTAGGSGGAAAQP